MRLVKWRFKTLVKIIIAVFVVTTFIVHYTNEKFEKTAQILKGIGNRDVKSMVQPFVDTFLINNHWLIRDNTKDDVKTDNNNINLQVNEQEDPFVVIAVTSQPNNEDRRNLIRETWMKYDTEKSIIVVFFCGRPRSQDMAKLQKESEKFGDIIVDDFEENYYGLTVKSLRILKWFTMNLPKSSFLVKTDDDVYINTPRLIQHLQRVHTKLLYEAETNEKSHTATPRHYMAGVVFEGRSPHTLNTFSKWYVPPKLWKEEVAILTKLVKSDNSHHALTSYPPYLEGNFYIISGHTVPVVLNTSLQLPLFHLEDVYISGFVGSELLNIKLDQVPNVFSDSATWPRMNYRYNTLFTSPKDMIAYHCDKDVDIIRLIYDETLADD